MSNTTPLERKDRDPSRSQVTSLYIEDSPIKSKRGSLLKTAAAASPLNKRGSQKFRPTSSNYDNNSLRASVDSSVFAVFINDSILPTLDSSISLDTDEALSADISQGNSLSSGEESLRERSPSATGANLPEVSKDSRTTESGSQYFDASDNMLDPPFAVLREFHLAKSNRISTHTPEITSMTSPSARNSRRGGSNSGGGGDGDGDGINSRHIPSPFVRNLTSEIEIANTSTSGSATTRSQQAKNSPRTTQGRTESERIRASHASESSNIRGSVSLSIQTVSTSKLVDDEDETSIRHVITVPSGSVLQLSGTDKLSTRDYPNTPSLQRASFTHSPLHRVAEAGRDNSHLSQRNLVLSSPTTDNSSWDRSENNVELDIEGAMDLLKKEMRDSFLTPIPDDQPPKTTPQWISIDESTPRHNLSPGENHLRSDSNINDIDEFVPQEYNIIRKVTKSPSIPPKLPSSSPELYQPRSPALINKFVFTTEPDTPVEFKAPTHQPFAHQIEIDNLPIPTQLMKVPLLRTISGSSRWKPNPDVETDISTFSVLDGKSLLGSHPSTSKSVHRKMSLGENPILEEPVQNNETPQITNVPAPSNGPSQAASVSNPVAQPAGPNDGEPGQAELAEPRPSATSVRRNTSVIKRKLGSVMDVRDMQSDVEAQPMAPVVQTVDTQSIESFDSGEYKFSEIYSLRRITLMLLLCVLCPPLFFMVGVGPKGGVDDYHLLKLILNEQHRVSLLKGFIWDVDVVWIRTGCLIMGVAELLAASACIGVGFGVGLR